jgi:hypothetical protein
VAISPVHPSPFLKIVYNKVTGVRYTRLAVGMSPHK